MIFFSFLKCPGKQCSKLTIIVNSRRTLQLTIIGNFRGEDMLRIYIDGRVGLEWTYTADRVDLGWSYDACQMDLENLEWTYSNNRADLEWT